MRNSWKSWRCGLRSQASAASRVESSTPLFERRPEIKSTPGLATSDRVILCGPIWAGRVAGPIRTWLNEHGKQGGQFVWVPHSGANRAWPKAIAEITDLTGHPPSRVFPFAQSDFAKGKAEGKATELAASLKQLT